MMREEDAHLLESFNGPYHPNIEHLRGEEQLRLKKASKYFDNAWVMEKERELRDLQRKEDATTDVKRTLQYMVEVTVEAPKLNFPKEEVSWLAKLVLLEWRKKAVDIQWVCPSQAQCINSIWCPYPILVKRWKTMTLFTRLWSQVFRQSQ